MTKTPDISIGDAADCLTVSFEALKERMLVRNLVAPAQVEWMPPDGAPTHLVWKKTGGDWGFVCVTEKNGDRTEQSLLSSPLLHRVQAAYIVHDLIANAQQAEEASVTAILGAIKQVDSICLPPLEKNKLT